MPTYESAPGSERAWNLLKKLGEGDAGEVYLVESILDKQVAILKRPRRSAFTSDVIRQSSQIEREAQILSALAPLAQTNSRLLVPGLLDRARPGNEFSERYFIVITRAAGFDLNFLARAIHFGALETEALPTELYADLDGAQRAYLQRLAQAKQMPPLILLRALSAAIEFLDTIHKYETSTPSSRSYGIIWNDVKSNHFFWDTLQSRLTLIDWGNAHFLEADGATTDRQHSRLDDYLQFMSEMGSFLSNHAPDLYERLDWRTDFSPADVYTAGIKPIQERITTLLGETIAELRHARQKEAEISSSNSLDFARFMQLGQVHSQIVTLGETPDYRAGEKFFLRLAAVLTEAGKWAEFQQLCEQAGEIPALKSETWLLLGQIAVYAQKEAGFQRAIRAAIKGNWPDAFWEMRSAARNNPGEWWENLSRQVRAIHLGSSKDTLTPYIALNRLIHALQSATLNQPADLLDSLGVDYNSAQDASLQSSTQQIIGDLRLLSPRWIEYEPDPPDSGIDYTEIERHLPAASRILPGPAHTLTNSLNQPAAQVKIVLEAWARRDFETARHGLRHVLLWDPDRLRLLLADEAIQNAATWLETLRRGPKKQDSLQGFVTHIELEGRDIRNQVGPAPWLDGILAALSKLRRGAEPADVLIEFASLRNDLGWLLEMEHNKPLLILPDKPVRLERVAHLPYPEESLRGVQEATIGLDQDFSMTDPLDTWMPEARGSSARVFQGFLRMPGTPHFHTAAIKLMRPDRAEYAIPLFREEVQILSQLRGVAGIIPLLEFGFIQLSEGIELPPEDRQISAGGVTGRAIRFGVNSVHYFLHELPAKTGQGWLPYLATAKVDLSENLLLLCDASYTRGRYLPLLDGLRMAIQILEILEACHARNISYRDHKILHYFWQEANNGIMTIDWNIARRHPEGISLSETQFDLVQFSARALHHIITGRPAPGALPLGPTTPQEIDSAARSYSARWTYDDQRLPTETKEILEKSLSGSYSSARALREDLLRQFQALSQLIPKE